MIRSSTSESPIAGEGNGSNESILRRKRNVAASNRKGEVRKPWRCFIKKY
jgi:hypothetical protein